MDFNCEIRASCKKLMQLITLKEISEDCTNGIIRQLKQDYDYITEQDVKKSIESMRHKFVIHAEYEKSRYFKQLVTKYIQLTAPSGLTHPTWSILHLLIRLAYRPTEKIGFAREGQVLGNLHGDINKSLEYDEATRYKNVLQKEMLQSVPETVTGNWTDYSDDDEMQFDENTEENTPKLQPSCSSSLNIPIFPLFQFKKNELRRTCLNKLIQKKYGSNTRVSEFQLLHELMWCLKSCKDDNSNSSFLTFSSNGSIQTRTVSLVSLPEYELKYFCPMFQGLKHINSFLNHAGSLETYTLTHQAYAAALGSIVARFYRSLSNFEQRVAEQNSTITLSHLLLFLKPWKHNILTLSEMHESIMSCPMTDNNSRVTRLLSILFDSAQKAQIESYSTLYPILLQLLSSSLEPFLNMVDVWLNQGQLSDPYQEFGIIRNESISPQNESFWFESLLIRPTHPFVNFLQPLMDDILLGGRSVELLTQLNRLLNVNCSTVKSDSHSRLIDIFQHRFNRRFKSESPHSAAFPSLPEPFVVCANNNKSNPLLIKTFANIRTGFYRKKKSYGVELNNSHSLSTPPEFYPLLPLLHQSLLEPIRNRQRLLCKALLSTLYEACSLKVHILTLRQVHFMQAGDLMGRFSLQLFQKVEAEDKWDNESNLTLSLLNCISPRISKSARFISVSIQRDSIQATNADLKNLRINYKIPWPVNLIIMQDSMILYNNVFQFLLRIKHALISLQRLSFKELSDMVVGQNSSPHKKEMLSATARRHRLQLLRSWLLYFVSSVDNYIMECVLESSHIRLDMQLDSAVHLGQIIESHQVYVRSIHKQCLQEASGAFLRDAINEVLSISLEVASVWTKGIETEELTKLEESYVHHHQFVAAVLGTDAAHSMLPYADTLAAALITSCPASRKE